MSEQDEKSSPGIQEDLVVTKYKMAAEFCNQAMSRLISMSIPGARILDICVAGDEFLQREASNVFKKDSEMKKGVAYPTCVCVNNYISNYSPILSEGNVFLNVGDLVKINLGVQIDGFPVLSGHSFVVTQNLDEKNVNIITGRCADVILAAHNVAEACLRLIRVGSDSVSVSEMCNRVAAEYHCKPIEGVQCHLMSRGQFQGKKTVILNPNDEQKKAHEKCTFEQYEVWNVVALVSTGSDARPRESDLRTTVYRRNPDTVYSLKMKSSRQFLREINTRFPDFPFTVRSFEDERQAKLGVVECRKHDLLESMPVYKERDNELVALFQYTLLLMPNGGMRIGYHGVDTSLYHSQFKITSPEIKTILSSSVSTKKKNKKKSKRGDESENNLAKEEEEEAFPAMSVGPSIVSTTPAVKI